MGFRACAKSLHSMIRRTTSRFSFSSPLGGISAGRRESRDYKVI